MEKRMHYDERICNVDRGSFTPLVLTISGGIGPTANTFYKRLASLHVKNHMLKFSVGSGASYRSHY